MIRVSLYIPDELHHWIANQAQVYQRSKNKQIRYLLERAKKDASGPRYQLSSTQMCANGVHQFAKGHPEGPAMGDFCNCHMFMYGEVKE